MENAKIHVGKRIKVELTIATGQYENAKPTIEVEIPDNLTPIQEYWYLYDMFHNIKRPNAPEPEKTYPNTKWGKLQARKDGVALDNDPYLDGDEDEGGKRENFIEHAKGVEANQSKAY